MPDRFPPPYIVKEQAACFCVYDANGFPIVRFYFDDRHHIGTGFDNLTRKQAYAFAANFAKLPALLLGSK